MALPHDVQDEGAEAAPHVEADVDHDHADGGANVDSGAVQDMNAVVVPAH